MRTATEMIYAAAWMLAVPMSCMAQAGNQADTSFSILPKQLEELTVKGRKPIYEQQPDRLVLNIQNSISASGNTILDILQKSPVVVVNRQNSSISMNGKAGAQIMVNGEMMQVPMHVAIEMLAGMTAANVEKIELIQTPPSQYDAEGNAGIIHIVTKQNADLGTNGSAGLMLGAKWAENLGLNFNLSHREKKVAWFLDYAVLRDHNLHTMKMERIVAGTDYTGILTDQSRRGNVTTQHNLSAGMEWKLGSTTVLNVGLTGYRRNWKLDAFTNGSNRLAADSVVTSGIAIRESNIWQSATAAIGLQTRIRDNSSLSISLDYLFYHNSNPSGYDTKVVSEKSGVTELSKIDLQKTTPIRTFVFKTDYRHTFSPAFTIETGVKGVASLLENNVLTRRLVQNEWITNARFTSFDKLRETIRGAYISAKWQMARRWMVNSGLRYEHTNTRIRSASGANLVNRNYGYFFPSLLITKELGNEKDIQLSYSRRITRPTYNDIASYVFFWGTNAFSAGNTALYPSISDAVRLGYHLGKWTIAINLSHSAKEIVFMQPAADKSDNIIMRSQNLKFLNTAAVTTSYSWSPVSWWDIQGGVTVQYQVARTEELVRLALFGANLNLTSLIRLPLDFTFEISGTHQSASLSGISKFLPSGSLNAGIQKKIGGKTSLKLAVDDILYTNKWRISTFLPSQKMDLYFRYNWHNQFVRLTLNRSFGESKLRSVKTRSASEEERSRVN